MAFRPIEAPTIADPTTKIMTAGSARERSERAAEPGFLLVEGEGCDEHKDARE